MTSKPSKRVYRASVYLRLSKEDGDVASGSKNESNSIANQKSLILDYLKDKPDIQVVSVREDDGYSGVNFDRPGFQTMLEDVKKGNIDCIIVKDLSRFGRNYIEAGRYLEKLFPVLGVRFIAVNDNYDSLNTDMAYDIVLPFKNLINDSYCRDLSVKIRSHLAVKRKNGEFIGAFACYGYLKDPEDRHKLAVDTYAATVVQDIFRLKINGYSQYRIANLLNQEGILSPMEYKRSLGIRFETSFKEHPKALWSAKAVSRILTNEVYTGVLVQGKQTTPNHKIKIRQAVAEKDWVRVEHTHTPLIDPRLFEIVQILLERDTRTSPSGESVFPLSGMLYCGDCGQPMVRKSTSYVPERSSSTHSQKYAYFICHGHSQARTCSWHRIREKDLLDTVLHALNHHVKNVLDNQKALQDLDAAASVFFLIQKHEHHIEKQELEIKRNEKLKAGIYEDLKDGLLDRQEYLTLQHEFDSRMEEAAEAIRHHRQEIQTLKDSRTKHYAWMDYFRQFGELQELTRWAAAITINRILVFEDHRIKILFHFEDAFLRVQEHLNGLNTKEGV